MMKNAQNSGNEDSWSISGGEDEPKKNNWKDYLLSVKDWNSRSFWIYLTIFMTGNLILIGFIGIIVIKASRSLPSLENLESVVR